jgi:methylated-DNA-protein-cysteine methyltransferase-like protein
MATDPAGKARQSAGKGRRRQTAASLTADPIHTPAGAVEPECPMDAAAADRIRLVVSRIPRGTVSTYGAVAALAGLPGRARLVGRTLAALPARTRLPWHRVVNAGLGLSPRGDPAAVAEQRRRLEAEGIRFRGDRVDRAHRWEP